MEAEERPVAFNQPDNVVLIEETSTIPPRNETDGNQVNGSSSRGEDSHQSPEAGVKRKRTPPPDGMSRSAYKKQKRQLEWEAGKADRKARRKEKEKASKAARKEAIAAGEELPPPKPKPARGTGKGMSVPVTFVIDCGFDELMTENEIKSLASQITRCYSDISRSPYKPHLAVSSLNGRLEERFNTVLQKAHEKWHGVNFYSEEFVSVASTASGLMRDETSGGAIAGALKQSTGVNELPAAEEQQGEVIYLSSESDNTLESLKPYSTYIIGGLVDRNRHKGICYKRACDRGIKTARLPIGEFMEMSSRKVLTTNHVNEIMLRWLESDDWGDAFVKAIPKRKGGALKQNGQNGEAEEDGTEGDEEEGIEGQDPVLNKSS